MHSYEVLNVYNSTKIAARIKQLAEMDGKTIKDVLTGSGLNKNAVVLMLSRGSIPRADNLAKIADYFGVSVDFLLDREEPFGADVTEKTASLLTSETVSKIDEPELYKMVLDYRMMSPKNQAILRNNQIKLLDAQKIEFDNS
jgi:transcriptional regulator with XRE-family HTH domain